MNIISMSFPASSNNINVVRKLAKEKDYTLKIYIDAEVFDLIDNQDGSLRFCKAQLEEIYDFLCTEEA